jgi:hypothetical protein
MGRRFKHPITQDDTVDTGLAPGHPRQATANPLWNSLKYAYHLAVAVGLPTCPWMGGRRESRSTARSLGWAWAMVLRFARATAATIAASAVRG